MFYLIDWRKNTVISRSESEQECRDERERLIANGLFDDFDLVIAQSVE